MSCERLAEDGLAPVRVDLDADPVAVARDLERRIASMDTVTSV